ncbi:LPXTG cell wall anchor domain-containing protein [Kitasatospora griseola]|uniref:LPXTG cell wall anchor domain-containing protein n=1 Tax=Kitasatospora griseola TaxID=2064 RepID=UPI0016706946
MKEDAATAPGCRTSPPRASPAPARAAAPPRRRSVTSRRARSPKPEPTKPGHEHERLPETGSGLTVPAAAGAGVLLLLGGGLIRWRRKGQRH